MRRSVPKSVENLSKETPKSDPGASGASRFCFGPFVLDPAEHRLERHGVPVLLTPRVFALLLALVESAGHLVTKETLLQRVWPGTAVEEANLSVQVSRLRRFLADGCDGTPYVETVAKFGYRFVAPVQVAPATDPGLVPPGPGKARRQPADARKPSMGASEQVRLTIQLTRLRDGETLWTEEVEGVLREPLGVQQRITEEIADILARLKVPRRRPPGSQ
jgi:DNA-binding winged helix-turn-helix (wHTH) protein